MAEYFDIGAALAFDALMQSTIILGAGLLVARSVRLPARQHALLAIAFACAVLTPLASSMVRVSGWGFLSPEPIAMSALPVATRAAVSPNESPAPRPQLTRFTEPSEPHHAPDFAQSNDREPLKSATLADQATPQGANADAAKSMPAGAIGLAESSHDGQGSLTSAGASYWMIALAAFVTIWCAGSLWALARLLRCVFRGGRILTTAEPCVSDAVDAALVTARDRLGLAALHIEVLQSPSVRCPVIWCWGRYPRLVLPAGAVAGWSADTWTPILCHELAHWLRRDHLIALAAELGCCLLPWQPLAWWAKRRMENSCEQACDDWAVATGHSPADYAETLLGLVAQNGSPLELAALRRRSGLALRIRHILTERVPRPHLGRRWAVAVVSVAVLAAGSAAFCQRGVARAEPALEVVPVATDKAATEPATARDKAPEVKPSDPAPANKPVSAATTPAANVAKPATPAMSGTAKGGSMQRATGSFQAGGAVGELLAADKLDQASTEPREFTAAGRVVDPAGKPVAGATVTWEALIRKENDRNPWRKPQANLGETTTDAEGRFSVTAKLVENEVVNSHLMIRSKGYGLRGYNTVLQKLAEPLEIQLDPSYQIEGTVFTPNGEPVSGARVTLTNIQRSSGDMEDNSKPRWWSVALSESELRSVSSRAAWPSPVRTDENGVFRFADEVPIPASAKLMIEADNFATTPVMVKHEQTVIDPRDEERDNYREPNFTLVLETPWTVEGRFTDEKSGEPIPGVELTIMPGMYGRGMHPVDYLHATTDEDGHYKFLAGSADYYHATVAAPLGYPGVQNSLNSSTLEKLAGKGRKVKYDVKLRRGVVLHGKVVAEDTGEPVPNVQVTYRPENGRKLGTNSDFASVKTGADGTFELTGASGKGFLLVDAPNLGFYRQVIDDKRAQRYREATYPHGILEVDIPEEGPPQPTTISLKRGIELVVRVLSPAGEPVSKVTAAYVEQDMDRYYSSEDGKDGVFRINAAQPGRKYRVHFFSEDTMAGIFTELEVPADGHTLEVKLEPCATIRGRYVFSGGGAAEEVQNFPHFKLDPQEEDGSDFEIYNTPFYYNFARRTKPSEKAGQVVTDTEGNFVLEGIVPGAFMYLALNYKFESGKTYHPVGTLTPGEVKDLGDVVIQSR